MAKTETAQLFFDVGKVGPDYLPGHAHADTLSFELSLFGNRLFVNGGTSTYVSALRHEQRSTKSHNTLTINELNSSEVWASFRVAQRAKTKRIMTKGLQNKIFITAEHDGYERLRKGLIHRRALLLGQSELIIKDRVWKSDGFEIKSHFKIHPRYMVKLKSQNIAEIFDNNGRKRISYNVGQ